MMTRLPPLALRRIALRSMSQVLMLEFLIVLMVLGIVLGLLVREIPTATDKARFTEVLLGSRKGQIELMERLALTGSTATANPDAASAALAPAPRQKTTGPLALSAQVQSDSYVVTGKLPNREQRFSLAFSPSVIQDEAAGSVLWLCGHQRPPAGWTGPANGPGSDLRPEELPFVCRHHGGYDDAP